jgi:CRISPR-associated protein Csa3
MRLAVTVGFESRLVMRALARLGPVDDYFLLRGITGKEGDRESAETVSDLIRTLGKGQEIQVDLVDLSRGLNRIVELEFDIMALAGGPRALILLAFVAAILRKSDIYLVPEFSIEPVRISGFRVLQELGGLTEARLRAFVNVGIGSTAEDVAKRIGVDKTTAYRHLEWLADRGLVRVEGGRMRRYSADPLSVAVASGYLRLMEKEVAKSAGDKV